MWKSKGFVIRAPELEAWAHPSAVLAIDPELVPQSPPMCFPTYTLEEDASTTDLWVVEKIK